MRGYLEDGSPCQCDGNGSGGSQTGALTLSRIELTAEAGDDSDRILDHLARYQLANSGLRIREIIEVFNVLEHNPMIARPVINDKRESVIGRRSCGHVALHPDTLSKSMPFLPCAARGNADMQIEVANSSGRP